MKDPMHSVPRMEALLAGTWLCSLALAPGVDVLDVVVELDRNPVVIRRPVWDVHGLRSARVAPWLIRERDCSVRWISCGHPDVDTSLEGLRKEERDGSECRDLIETGVEWNDWQSGGDRRVAQYVERRGVIWITRPSGTRSSDPHGVAAGTLIGPPLLVPDENRSAMVRASLRVDDDWGGWR